MMFVTDLITCFKYSFKKISIGKLSGVTDATNKVFSPLSVAQAGCNTNCNSDKLTGSKSYCSAEYSLDADGDGKTDMDGDQVKK